MDTHTQRVDTHTEEGGHTHRLRVVTNTGESGHTNSGGGHTYKQETRMQRGSEARAAWEHIPTSGGGSQLTHGSNDEPPLDESMPDQLTYGSTDEPPDKSEPGTKVRWTS